MELRDIEIFLTLADELHFGRTAERLRISQARVSQSIKLQERRLGTRLFERTSRNVALTHIGARLRDDLRVHYDGIQTAFARARDAAGGVTGTLRLGVMGAVGYLSRDLIDAFRRRYADCVVQVREIHFSDPLGPLRAGQVDVALLWRPIREPGLTEGPVVLTEGRVLAVAAGHELADHTSVSLEDLGDRVVIDPGPLAPDYWVQAMVPALTPGGRPVMRGPTAHTFHEILNLVAAGECVIPLNEHVVQHYSHPGIIYLPIRDAPPTEWSLVWHTAAENASMRAFANEAKELGPRQS